MGHYVVYSSTWKTTSVTGSRQEHGIDDPLRSQGRRWRSEHSLGGVRVTGGLGVVGGGWDETGTSLFLQLLTRASTGPRP